MRAALYRSYGPPEVLQIEDVEQPSILEDDRVLIRVHCASVNPYDYLHRKGYLPVRLTILFNCCSALWLVARRGRRTWHNRMPVIWTSCAG